MRISYVTRVVRVRILRLPFLLAVPFLAATYGPAAAGGSGVQRTELGVGVVQPPIDPARPLYFYLSVDLSAYPPDVVPSDSLTFRTGDHFIDIATAPPWFVPETLELDYDLLFLRAVSLSRFWIEVVVNDTLERPRSFPRTAWVAREDVNFRPWSEFLLEVFSIEPLDPEANPLRTGPGEEFPVAEVKGEGPFRVLAVQGSWARVEGDDGNETSMPRGWIRWRDGDQLVVYYYLLS